MITVLTKDKELVGFPDSTSQETIDTVLSDDKNGTITMMKPSFYDRTLKPALEFAGIDFNQPNFVNAKNPENVNAGTPTERAFLTNAANSATFGIYKPQGMGELNAEHPVAAVAGQFAGFLAPMGAISAGLRALRFPALVESLVGPLGEMAKIYPQAADALAVAQKAVAGGLQTGASMGAYRGISEGAQAVEDPEHANIAKIGEGVLHDSLVWGLAGGVSGAVAKPLEGLALGEKAAQIGKDMSLTAGTLYLVAKSSGASEPDALLQGGMGAIYHLVNAAPESLEARKYSVSAMQKMLSDYWQAKNPMIADAVVDRAAQEHVANMAEEVVQEHIAEQEKAISPLVEIKDALIKFNEGDKEIATVEDVVNKAEDMLSEREKNAESTDTDAKLQDAIDEFRNEQDQDRKLKGRGDIDTAREKVMSVIEQYVGKETQPLQAKQEKSDFSAQVAQWKEQVKAGSMTVGEFGNKVANLGKEDTIKVVSESPSLTAKFAEKYVKQISMNEDAGADKSEKLVIPEFKNTQEALDYGKSIAGNDEKISSLTDERQNILDEIGEVDKTMAKHKHLNDLMKQARKKATSAHRSPNGMSAKKLNHFTLMYKQRMKAQFLREAIEEARRVGPSLGSESGQLDVTKIPGAQRTADMIEEAVHIFSPKTGVDPRVLDKIFEMKGGRDKVEFELERQMKGFEDNFDKMSQEKQVDFVDRIKRGEKQETPELQAVADMMRKIEDAYYAEVKKIEPDASYFENHFRVLWKERPGKAGEVEIQKGFNGLYRRPLQGTKGFLKRHVFEDMSEGLKLGYKPYSYNPMTMWRNSVMDMQKLITANRMFQSLKNMGMIEYVKFGGNAPEGFVKIDDSIGRVYFPVKEGMVNAGEYYIEEGAGRLLNNYLGKDAIRASAIGHTLLQFKNLTTALELSLSPFHAAYESGAAIATKIGLGTQKIVNSFDLVGGLTDLVSAGTAPADYAITGGRAIAYVTNPEEFIKTSAGESFIKEFPKAQGMINDLFAGGGKLAMHQDYKLNTLKALKEGLKNREPWAIAMHAIPGANEVIMKPLFEVFIPRLKTGAFLKEYSQALRQSEGQLESGEITRTTLARNTWASIEQRFGEMNFDNLFWNRNLKTSLQILVRSVTWKVGALKNLAYSVPEQLAEFSNAAKNGRMPQLKSNLGYLLGVATFVTVGGAIIQKLNIGEWPKDIKDYIAPRFNAMGDRITMNTHLKDWVHIIHSPLGFLTSSLTGEWGRMIDVMKNKDFFGTEIRHLDDPLTRQAWDSIKYLFPTPFSISNFKRLSELDAPLGIKASNVLGITQPTPKYISNTPAQNLAHEIMINKLPVGARTREKAQEGIFKNKLLQEYQKTGDESPINQAIEQKQISRREAREIKKDANLTPLQRTVNRFSFEELAKVMDTASDQERQSLLPMLKKKYTATYRNEIDVAKRQQMKETLARFNDQGKE